MFIGSADLMPRNLDHRVEVLAPIEQRQDAPGAERNPRQRVRGQHERLGAGGRRHLEPALAGQGRARAHAPVGAAPARHGARAPPSTKGETPAEDRRRLVHRGERETPACASRSSSRVEHGSAARRRGDRTERSTELAPEGLTSRSARSSPAARSWRREGAGGCRDRTPFRRRGGGPRCRSSADDRHRPGARTGGLRLAGARGRRPAGRPAFSADEEGRLAYDGALARARSSLRSSPSSTSAAARARSSSARRCSAPPGFVR